MQIRHGLIRGVCLCVARAEDCQRSFTEHTWKSVVQVRQKVSHKKTFFFLEQLILKHNAHAHTINIENVPDGVDFFFSERSHAAKFVDFLASVVATRFRTAKQLVSSDLKVRSGLR